MIITSGGVTKTGLERLAHVDVDRNQTVCVRITLPRGRRGKYQLNRWTGTRYELYGTYGGLHAVRAAEALVVAEYEKRVVKRSEPALPEFKEPTPHSIRGVMSAGLPTLGKRR